MEIYSLMYENQLLNPLNLYQTCHSFIMRFKKRFVTPRIWKHLERTNDCYYCILKRRKQSLNKLSFYSYPSTKSLTLRIPMEVYNLVSSSQPLSS
ncbi:hypothetical protein A3Q56_08293 [Intoshia linei]|uniref:Uncharacterized protein n=1 Tax=Intoshia linei TaxID=1819745 RepID=A0A177ARY7_9BILA|nr:hypothetical protein A3Q56_08293 [Intoshia linei]